MGIKLQIDSAACDNVPGNSVGVLIGTTSPQIRILSLIPSPKVPQSTSLHKWCVEHAKLLSNMCLGGINILGTYAPLSRNSTHSAAIDTAAAIAREIISEETNAPPIVLYSGLKGRISAKEVRSVSEGFKSADIKQIQGLLDSTVILRAIAHAPPVLFPLSNDDNMIENEKICANLLNRLLNDTIISLNASEIVLVTSEEDETILASTMGWELAESRKKKNISYVRREPISAVVYLPLADKIGSDCKQIEPSANTIRLSGAINVNAVITQDSSLGSVLKAVRDDLSRSLKVRLQLLREADEEELESSEVAPAGAPCAGSRLLPRRVIVTPPSDTKTCIPFCNYVLPGDSLEDDVLGHCSEILSWKPGVAEKSNIEEVEAPESVLQSSQQPPRIDNISISDISSKAPLEAQDSGPPPILVNGLIAAVVIGFIAIVLKEIVFHFV